MTWKQLESVAPQDLKQARLSLHFAAQVVSGVGRTLLPHQDDDSHTNLVWLESAGGLASHTVPGPKPFRAALDFERFRLLLLDAEARELAAAALEGLTLDQAYAWLAAAIASHTDHEFAGFKALHYEMPDHPLGQGAAFTFEPVPAFGAMSRWYSNAAAVLKQVQHEHSAGAVRCWPHHFDMATLISLGADRTIGVGLSPDDGSYDEPYWYVGPWPHPKPEHWPALEGGGRWHTDGFVAAVLKASDFVSEKDQTARLEQFLTSAISASKKLLS